MPSLDAPALDEAWRVAAQSRLRAAIQIVDALKSTLEQRDLEQIADASAVALQELPMIVEALRGDPEHASSEARSARRAMIRALREYISGAQQARTSIRDIAAQNYERPLASGASTVVPADRLAFGRGMTQWHLDSGDKHLAEAAAYLDVQPTSTANEPAAPAPSAEAAADFDIEAKPAPSGTRRGASSWPEPRIAGAAQRLARPPSSTAGRRRRRRWPLLAAVTGVGLAGLVGFLLVVQLVGVVGTALDSLTSGPTPAPIAVGVGGGSYVPVVPGRPHVTTEGSASVWARRRCDAQSDLVRIQDSTSVLVVGDGVADCNGWSYVQFGRFGRGIGWIPDDGRLVPPPESAPTVTAATPRASATPVPREVAVPATSVAPPIGAIEGTTESTSTSFPSRSPSRARQAMVGWTQTLQQSWLEVDGVLGSWLEDSMTSESASASLLEWSDWYEVYGGTIRQRVAFSDWDAACNRAALELLAYVETISLLTSYTSRELVGPQTFNALSGLNTRAGADLERFSEAFELCG